MTEYIQDRVFPPVLIILEWNIYCFSNNIDFVTNILPYVSFSGNLCFCKTQYIYFPLPLKPDHISFCAWSFLLVQINTQI